MTWDEKIDIFSAACTIWELRQGSTLFRVNFRALGFAETDIVHLAKMERILGTLPQEFIRQIPEEGIQDMFRTVRKEGPRANSMEHYVLNWPRRHVHPELENEILEHTKSLNVGCPRYHAA